MRKGMRPCWVHVGAPGRIVVQSPPPEYQFSDEEEKALQDLPQKEIKEKVIRFFNSVFVVPKKTTEKGKRKFRKVVNCKRLNREQREIHFRMDGPGVV
jgi:hypothetical protein